MTLSELKAQAQALGLTKEFVSEHGDLRYKSTWQAAINVCESSESEPEQKPEPIDFENATIGVIVEIEPEDEAEETVSDNLFEPLVEPEVINITRESYPEIWQHLEPPTEPEAVPVSYQVITESPSIPPIYFSRPEQKRTVPKLPGQDFFVWLFSPPKVSVINQ